MRTLIRRHACSRATCCSAWLSAAALAARRPEPPRKHASRDTSSRPTEGWKPLFNGKDLSGWKFRNPRAKKVWVVCDRVRLDPADPARLVAGRSAAELRRSVLLCGDDGRGSDIMTDESFTDYQLHIEFTVPKGSNSGVYNRGLFEIQVFDSFGKPKLGFHDCGALYERAFPRENLAKPPGEWQSYDITLKGKKLSAGLEWQDGLPGPGRPLRRDRPRGVRAAQPGKRGQAGRAAGQAPRGEWAATSATSAKAARGPASTAPIGPGRSSCKVTMARSPIGIS